MVNIIFLEKNKKAQTQITTTPAQRKEKTKTPDQKVLPDSKSEKKEVKKK